MSVQSAKEFIQRVTNDEAFKNSYVALQTSEERQAFFKQEGFDFTKEEFDGVRSELSDNDLDNVAGGFCYDHIGCAWN